MRVISMMLAATAFALAQSHPSWWTLASPDATALVGIRWETLRQSVFAEPVAAEFASSGGLGFPDLDCLKHAGQILISSPALLAIATGQFDPLMLRAQAAGAGMKPATYKNVALWISPGKTTLSVAQLSDQLVLVGLRKTLESAIDRDSADTGRRYSPLLARAARYARSKDLWVVATQLPDPLASLFIPIEAESGPMEGSVSIQNGLQIEASLDAGSADAAAAVAENLRGSIATLPAIARSLQVTVDAQHVLLALDINKDQLVASLRQTPDPAPIEAAPPEPVGPQIIRIFGLDDGPREILLPRKEPRP